jgi:hypothetical protein
MSWFGGKSKEGKEGKEVNLASTLYLPVQMNVGGQTIQFINPEGEYLLSITKQKGAVVGGSTNPTEKLKNDITGLASKIDPLQQEIDNLK